MPFQSIEFDLCIQLDQISIKLNQQISNMFVPQNFGYNPGSVPKSQKTGEEVYFDGSKKNELNDLKKYLKSILTDPQKEYYRKEVIKKVISYTTAGIDTSRLYPQIVMASATRDPVEKKLIYLYLSIYSATNQNFARMAINTFQKDISSPNPNVRALAVRSLANLRFKGREEYALPAFTNGLNDFVPLVKRSCMMGLVKIAVEQARSNSNHVRDEALLSKFYELLREQDASVVCTALEAINQVEEGGLSMSRKLAFYLLNNLHRYSDFQLPVIAGYLQLYDPKNEQEVVEILTALEPRLKSSNAAAVLAISKVFVKAGKQHPELMEKLLKSIRKSLLSFLHHQVPEIQYTVLRHIEYLIRTLKTDVFHSDYKKFMVGGNEPSYLRITKIRLLRLTSNSLNFSDVINELAEYLFDDDISHEAVRALAELIKISSENDARYIAKTVVKTIDAAPLPTLCDHALPLVAGYLRLYPQDFQLFANIFYLLAENAREDDSRCALLEIIGDFGQFIEDAPELIVLPIASNSDRLKISLLRATAKLFLKRPREMVETLTKLLKSTLTDDQTHLNVKDYASYLYRGLQSGIEEFKSGFLECRPHRSATPSDPEELQFNSLQIMYGAKSEKWLLDPTKFIDSEDTIPEEAQGQQATELQQPREIHVDLQSRFQKLEVDNFDITFSLSSDEFERCWEEYDIGSSITRMVKNIDMLGQDNLEELFKLWNITVLASAESQQEIKFYNYCKVQTAESDLGVCCMECVFNKLAETVTLMIKSDDEELAGFVSRYIEDILRINQII